jgi:hypothetical protein
MARDARAAGESREPSRSSGLAMTPSIVQNRVDALTVAYRVKLSERATNLLRSRARVAFEHGRCLFVDSANVEWELKIPRRGDGQMWRLRREDHVRIQIDPKAPGGHKEIIDLREPTALTYENAASPTLSGVIGKVGYQMTGEVEVIEDPGWTFELVWYAGHLAEMPLDLVLVEGREIVKRFGEIYEERIRRIDMAADVAGFDIRDDDFAHFIRRARVKEFPFSKKPNGDDGFREQPMLPAFADTVVTKQIAGIRFGRTDVVARIYDKREELEQKGSPDKRAREEAVWTKNGWNGSDPVSRVEFQLRGEALTELGARDPKMCGVHPKTGELLGAKFEMHEFRKPMTLPEYVPRLWSTCLDWLWLGVPEEGVARSRWKEDQRWTVLRNAKWASEPKGLPIKRVRIRGGASAAQALGSMASMIAAAGVDLAAAVPENLRVTKDGHTEISEESKDYEESPVEKLESLLAILTHFGADEIQKALVERWGDETKAALHVAIVMNAARGRFPVHRPKPPAEKIPLGQISFWEWAQSKKETENEAPWQAN